MCVIALQMLRKTLRCLCYVCCVAFVTVETALESASTSARVSAVCHTGYCQLQQLCPLVQCLSKDTTKIPILQLVLRDTALDWIEQV